MMVYNFNRIIVSVEILDAEHLTTLKFLILNYENSISHNHAIWIIPS
ncbi:MAG: hypothetical protein ACI8ZM_003588 [Crocinitomix sp.]|jgi:hypothetical protein